MTINRWKYGDSWEKYPIESEQTWIEACRSKVMVHDIFNGLPQFMKDADLIYTDPPWNTGNINSFYTKAMIKKRTTFEKFSDVLFGCIADIHPTVCYLEIGKQNLQRFMRAMAVLYPVVQSWETTYYKKNKSYLIRGGATLTDFDFFGQDDMDIPALVMQNEVFSCVGDLCMGRGLTGITAYRLGKRFVGTEMNKRRLAVLIDKTTKLGAWWSN
ncbi:MAG: hypothetical protein D4S01_09670 [Dehalococcoidia bacterium]|nr:MAG: hypothetical protein D4S01_09670 [Dehalococcoidia bacterium]